MLCFGEKTEIGTGGMVEGTLIVNIGLTPILSKGLQWTGTQMRIAK